MKVNELAQKLDMKILTGNETLFKDITGVYVCDLLSWVMSHAEKGNAWITIHTHLNIVAVALLTEVSCVIIPENLAVEENTIKKAEEEGIVILSSSLSAYELCYRIHELLA
ncbi:MAG TPA: AraC family transcriptional regulator [Clostridiaceae bacterium]|nr:AraC family transcriptional regulator [Clostridiaceae bacterium]